MNLRKPPPLQYPNLCPCEGWFARPNFLGRSLLNISELQHVIDVPGRTRMEIGGTLHELTSEIEPFYGLIVYEGKSA